MAPARERRARLRLIASASRSRNRIITTLLNDPAILDGTTARRPCVAGGMAQAMTVEQLA
jgi:hypothetical protein